MPFPAGVGLQRGIDQFLEIPFRDDVAWISDRGNSVEGQTQAKGAVEFRLVAGGHQHHSRQGAQERLIHEAVMHRAVVADEPGPIHAEDDRQSLQGHFLPDLIEGPLEEGGIDGGEGPHAALGHSGGHGGQMALADAGVHVPVGDCVFEFGKAGAIGHGGGQGHDAAVLLGQVDHGVGKSAGP